eukprot:SAG31_NODE_2084_length_6489_cov_7.773239_10_plen_158_part_01
MKGERQRKVAGHRQRDRKIVSVVRSWETHTFCIMPLFLNEIFRCLSFLQTVSSLYDIISIQLSIVWTTLTTQQCHCHQSFIFSKCGHTVHPSHDNLHHSNSLQNTKTCGTFTNTLLTIPRLKIAAKHEQRQKNKLGQPAAASARERAQRFQVRVLVHS